MGRILYIFTITYLLFGIAPTAFSQVSEKLITGEVTDKHGQPIPYSTVSILHTTIGAVTNEKGYFTFRAQVNQKAELITRSLGYTEQQTTLNFGNKSKLHIKISLTPSTTKIGEVLIIEKSETAKVRERPFTVSAINAKPLQVRNLDVNGLLAMSAGVKIREEGGMGSGFTFSLNGFSGNQVKFFLDGVPMDNFGSSLSLNNIPVNLISSIEVYKGVIPVELGIDALGGAVNIITNQNTKRFLDVSYSTGSFNTHRFSAISRYTLPKSGLQIDVNAFYNYSDNNYKILAEVPDPDTGSIGDPVEVTRFHDAYKSLTGQIVVGVDNKSYADKLSIGLLASSNYKEEQTGYNMTKVAGQVHRTSQRLILNFKYAKKDILIPKLDLRLFANYIHGTDLVVDTCTRKYDWYGNYTVKEFSTSGELAWDKTLFRFNDNSAMGTANISYRISPSHAFAINNTYLYFNRVGSDPISYNAVPFSEPNVIKKNITGLAYNQTLWGGKLKSAVFAKVFIMQASMYESAGTGTEKDLSETRSSSQNLGYGFASTWFISPSLQSKISFENTYRLPETVELFGNGLTLLESPNLTPEQSKNLNLSLAYNTHLGDNSLSLEATYLFRLPKNLIRIIAEGNQGWYENVADTKINSAEAEVKYSYKNKFRFSLNATYQDIVYNQKTTATGGVNYLYGIRLPNTPYLFGNLSLGYVFSPFNHSKNKISVDWNSHFVESFFLKTPNQGYLDSKSSIPQQLMHSVSISALLANNKYNISLSCTNLTNNELYDNFKLQKPGRAYSIKLRYFISKD